MSARVLVLPILLGGCLGGCPSSVAEPPPEADGTPAAPRVDEPQDLARAHAHERALERLRDAALPALAAFDPASASVLGRGPLRAPPASRASRQALREAIAPAQREREGIDATALSPEQAMLLRALEHATYRIDDELAGRSPLRTEPGAYLERLEPLVELVERGLCGGALDLDDARAALQSIATELDGARVQLGGASPAAVAAAIEDARALADRLRRLPAIAQARGDELTASAEAAAVSADALGEHFRTIEARLPTARTADRGAVLPASADPNAIRRLPDALGPKALAAALAAEAVMEPPSALLSRLVPQIARLSAMLEALPSAPEGAATPVTAERCSAAWRPIAAWVTTQPVLASATLHCDAFARRHEGVALDDADLEIALAIEGVVVPTRQKRRQEVDAALALVGGAITPHAQRDAMAISVLAGAGRAAAERRATARARDAACLAGAALLVHGEPGAAQGDGRLGAGCAHRTFAQWSADALARPHRSLRGLGLLLLGTGPADALAMHRFWWAPMGLVSSLARPPDPRRAELSPPSTKIETLSPGDPEPPR